MPRRHPVAIAVAVAALALGGCDSLDIFGTSEEPLPGTRIPVLLDESTIEPDERVADLDIGLPRPIANEAWPQQGGYPNHAMHHLELGDDPQRAWSADAGEGADDDAPILAGPVVADGRVYAMDADADVSAFDAGDGRRLWRRDIEPETESDGNWGGGLAYDNGRIYAGTGFAQVVALDAASGEELWRTSLSGPMRAAPTVFGGRVFAQTLDNQLFSLDAETGAVNWTHTGIEETAGLLGSSSPAVDGDIVVVAYSSGEIFALRVENGRPLWSDNLAAIRRQDAVSALADIRGRPVIDRGRVYAISHSGRMVATDLASGRRVWEAQIGGLNQPWVAGNFIYVVSTEGDVVALTAREGLVKWVTPLGRYEDPEDRDGLISWSGPVLAGDRLVVTGDHGLAVTLSPYTGAILGELDISGGVSISPAIANGSLYFLTDGADLLMFR